jgi:hypothetical protein
MDSLFSLIKFAFYVRQITQIYVFVIYQAVQIATWHFYIPYSYPILFGVVK